jgi:hypothetical protein
LRKERQIGSFLLLTSGSKMFVHIRAAKSERKQQSVFIAVLLCIVEQNSVFNIITRSMYHRKCFSAHQHVQLLRKLVSCSLAPTNFKFHTAGFYQVRQGCTWSRNYKSPSPPPPPPPSPPPTRFRILIF